MRRHGSKSLSEVAHPPRSKSYRGPFGRLFRHLPPYAPPSLTATEIEKLFHSLAKDMLEAPGTGGNKEFDNPDIPSGYTYFGQFVDHDITFDPVSSLQRQNDPNMLENFRTPRFDLDNLYGEGPDDEPFMYDQRKDFLGKFLIGKGRRINAPEGQPQVQTNDPTPEDDLPRNEQFRALIGDPRNDENIIVAQLQLAFLKFHNAIIDFLKAERGITEPNVLFREAQRMTRWHYQWVVIHDFLPRLVGRDLVAQLLPPPTPGSPQKFNLNFYHYEHHPFMPVEFSAAAYRMGHSMIRGAYKLNDVLDGFLGGKPLPIFIPPSKEPGFLDDLRGVRPLPQFWTLQWDKFLEFGGGGACQKSRLIDAKLAQALGQIPAGPGIENPLAFLNLKRGYRLELPSGQDVARALSIPPSEVLTNRQMKLPGGFGTEAPLWFYILKEAALASGGKQLGPVGAHIVAEVFIGLAKGDPSCFLNVHPLWRPELPHLGDNFELRDVIRFAGMPVTAAELPFPPPER